MIADYDKWREELLPAFCITAHGLRGDDDDHIVNPFVEKFIALTDNARVNGHDDKRAFQTFFRLFSGEPDYGEIQETCFGTVISMGAKNHQLFLETFLEELPRMMEDDLKGAATDWAFDCLIYSLDMKEFPEAFHAATEEQKALMRQLATKIDDDSLQGWMENRETADEAAMLERNVLLIKNGDTSPSIQPT
jgi:hypothetical protein